MQFHVDYEDGNNIVTCPECVQTLAVAIHGISDQQLSDIVNKHAFLAHGAKTYASVHLTSTPTPDKPYRRTASLAFTPLLTEKEGETMTNKRDDTKEEENEEQVDGTIGDDEEAEEEEEEEE